MPTTVSEVMAQYLSAMPQETVVIDMGCGAGFFAVLAARLGAIKVYAVDVTADAVELTKKNLIRNRVAERVEVLCGHLFEPLKGIKAHQIILDVSGIASRLARFTPWYPAGIAVASEDGTEPTVSALIDTCANWEEWVARVQSRFPTLAVCAMSAWTGAGMAGLDTVLRPYRTVVLVGLSGAGKSSLLNRLLGSAVAATGAVRPGDFKGRHTTTHRELFRLPQGSLLW